MDSLEVTCDTFAAVAVESLNAENMIVVMLVFVEVEENDDDDGVLILQLGHNYLSINYYYRLFYSYLQLNYY